MTSALAAALLAAPGCSSNQGWNEDVVADTDVAVCVDPDGRRVDDDYCDDDDSRRIGGGYGFFYLNRRAPIPYYGDSVHDRRYAGHGSYAPRPGATYYQAPSSTQVTRSKAVSRGGMGSRGRGFGGGRS